MPAPAPPAPRLLADAMLGALARWMRVLDVDTAYDPALDDSALVSRAVDEGRVLLSRDRRLLERRLARPHLLIRSDQVEQQVRQVLADLNLRPDPARLFCRCLRCNLPLDPMAAEEARAVVPPYVARTVEVFHRCPGCRRIYWRGTHVGRMEEWLHRAGLDHQASG
jgi:uncharacterized protein with PIN domain